MAKSRTYCQLHSCLVLGYLLYAVVSVIHCGLCLSAAVLDIYPGHADQPGEPVPGEDSQHAQDVCDDWPCGHGDRYPGAAGIPAEEGPRPAAHLLGGGLSPAQELQLKNLSVPAPLCTPACA